MKQTKETKIMIRFICSFTTSKHKDFKTECVKEGKSMNQVINELVQEYLDKKKAVA